MNSLQKSILLPPQLPWGTLSFMIQKSLPLGTLPDTLQSKVICSLCVNASLGFSICHTLHSIHCNLYTSPSLDRSKDPGGQGRHSIRLLSAAFVPQVPGTQLLHEHFPPAARSPTIQLTGDSPSSSPAWQGYLNPQHRDWLQLQGCVHAWGAGKVRRRATLARACAGRARIRV